MEKELDEETGLTYFGARYLDAEVGIWTAVDQMGQYHHSYSFVGGDPVNLADLWGLEGESSTPYYFPGKNLYIPSYPDQAAGMPTSDATRVAAKPPEPAPKPTVGQVLSLPEVVPSIPEAKLMAPPPGHPDAEPWEHRMARELEEWSNEKYSETGKTRYAIAHGLADYYLRTTGETERETVQGMGQGGTGSIKTIAKGLSSEVQEIATLLKAFKIKANPLNPTQEVNLSLSKGVSKINLRVETHPLPKRFGGTGLPQRHMNVDLFENGAKVKGAFPNEGHIILE